MYIIYMYNYTAKISVLIRLLLPRFRLDYNNFVIVNRSWLDQTSCSLFLKPSTESAEPEMTDLGKLF